MATSQAIIKDGSADNAESSHNCSQVRTELSESSDSRGASGLLKDWGKKASQLGRHKRICKGQAVPPLAGKGGIIRYEKVRCSARP